MTKLTNAQANKQIEHILVGILDRKLKKDRKLIGKVLLIGNHFKTHKWPLSYSYVRSEFNMLDIMLETLLFKRLKLKVKYKAGSGLVVYK